MASTVHKLLWGMEANPEEIWKGTEDCAVLWECMPRRSACCRGDDCSAFLVA